MRNIAALFTLVMPGCGQIYNGQILKGFFFLIIEHYDNAFGKINKSIFLDLNGFHQQALNEANFQYILFYPAFYTFCVWDAWFHAKPNADKSKTTIPFILAGLFGLFGTIYARKLPIPTLTVGFLMIIPMVFGMIIYRNQ
jgi:hypothetical protein